MAYRLTSDEARLLREAGWEPFYVEMYVNGEHKPLMLGDLVGWVNPADDIVYSGQEAVDMVEKREEA